MNGALQASVEAEEEGRAAWAAGPLHPGNAGTSEHGISDSQNHMAWRLRTHPQGEIPALKLPAYVTLMNLLNLSKLYCLTYQWE